MEQKHDINAIHNDGISILDNLLNANGHAYNSLFAIDDLRTLLETVNRAYFWDDEPTTDDERKAFSNLYKPFKTILNMLRKIVTEQCKREIESGQIYLIRAIEELKAEKRNDKTVATADNRNYVTAADMLRGKGWKMSANELCAANPNNATANFDE